MTLVDTSADAPSDAPVNLGPTPDAPEPLPGPDRTRLWIEVAVVLLIAVVPDLIHAVWSMLDPQEWSDGSAAQSLSAAIRTVQVVPPVLYLMWRSGEGWGVFGITRPRPVADILIALLVLFLSLSVEAVYGESIGAWLWSLDDHTTSDDYVPPATALETVLMVATTVSSAFAEELIIWGFLFTRLRRLLDSAVMAIVLAAAAFASYHVYQGFAGTGSVFVAGLVHGVVFQVWPRLWPLVLSHAAWNILVAGML